MLFVIIVVVLEDFAGLFGDRSTAIIDCKVKNCSVTGKKLVVTKLLSCFNY
jgi:hypothetical protein